MTAADEDSKVFTLSFSSEEPYDRFFDGAEILDHSDSAVDLSRLNEIGVVLYNHNRDDAIGRINRAWIENGKGYAEIEFDDDELSARICNKVKKGTLKGVSVGYQVGAWERVLEDCKSADGRFEGPCYVARKWAPYEVSIVTVPADPSVGVGREMSPIVSAEPEVTTKNENENLMEVKDMTNENITPVVDQPAVDMQKALADERARISEITGIARDLGMDCDEAIQSGMTVDAFRALAVENMRSKKAPIATGIQMGEQEADKKRAAISEAIMVKGGQASAQRNSFAGMSTKDLVVEALALDGQNASDLHRKSIDDVLTMATRAFYNPESAFPAILDNTVEKAYIEAYKKTPVTFDKFTSKGSLPDFKVHDNNYYQGPVGEFKEVPENGELKHDVFADAKMPTRQLGTYGRQFTISRKAFIDDDIGLIASLPARYAASAKKTINKQVFEILMKNPAIYDGVNLFDAAHKNVLAAGSAISQNSVQAMIMALSTQLDPFGEAIAIRPAQIVVPVGLGFDLYTLFNSATINTAGNTQAINPLNAYASSIEIVEDATINALAGGMGQVMPWFLVGDQMDCKGIEVDYLNGMEMPTIRRMEKPGTLGFTYDIFMDWGISVMDYRGIVKNPGVAVNLKEALA